MASTGLENLSDDELIAAFERASPAYKPAPVVPELVSGVKDYYKSLHEPTEPATSVKDFTIRVIPESMGKTAVGMVEYPYHLAKSFTDPLLTNEPLSGMGNALLSNAESIARGTGEPIGLYGLKALKERWLSDPVGSLLGVTPLVSSIKFKNINPVLREHVKTGKPISELIDIPRETIDTHIRKKSTEDLIRIVEQTKPKTIETEQNIGEYSPVLSNVRKEFKSQAETIEGVKPFKDIMQSRPQPEPSLPPGGLFKEPKITGIPETDTGISETDIARAKVINDEMSHPDYNKYGDVKELYHGNVYDLRFANPDDITNINNDIAVNYKELGLDKASKATDAKVMMRVLDRRVGDYSGVIGLDGQYYPSEFIFGKESIEQPKGVI